MYWQAPMVARSIGPEVLRRAFADAFGLDLAAVDVVDEGRSAARASARCSRILVERIVRDGPFPLQLNVFLGDPDVEQSVATLQGTLDRARDLARLLDATLLLGTGPIGHLEQIRVSAEGTVDVVSLDPDALDEERYAIVGSRRLTGAAVGA